MAEMINTDPVTVTFRASEWHLLLREQVYAATQVERVLGYVLQTADPKRDAWVVAQMDGLKVAVQALDKVAELLAESHARPVPAAR